jgi:replicative DNA helicase
MGKSAVAQQMAMLVAMQGKGVGFFALELSQDQMAARMLSALAKPEYGMLPYSKIYRVRAGLDKIDPSDVMALRAASKKLQSLPMFIDTRGGLRPSEVMAACRRIKRNFEKRGAPLSLIVIDHIGEMSPDNHCTSDYERASSIARWLKQATKALQVPILACVQINREAEKTNDKKPNRSMLRDSGRIEEIADSILLVHREAFYVERNKPSLTDPAFVEWQCDYERVKNKLTMICDKARMGRPGVAELWFCPGTTKLEDKAQ